MRTGEIRGLRWSFIDKDFIRIPLELTKTNKPNTKEKGLKVIPINENVRRILGREPRALHTDLVFHLEDREIEKMTLSRRFKRDCAKAGIPAGRKTKGGITFHDIRSTVKTNMANAGVDHTFRDALLGHSRKGMDAYYIQIEPKDLIPHMDKYIEWLNALLDKVLDKGQ